MDGKINQYTGNLLSVVLIMLWHFHSYGNDQTNKIHTITDKLPIIHKINTWRRAQCRFCQQSLFSEEASET